MVRVGVVLSGCGVMDGSEIHEAVITLLAIDRAGAEAVCMAPNVPQREVFDHYAGKVAAGEKRNVLVESARIARGNIRDIATVRASDVDALVLPGGYGAAKNLCDFAEKGEGATPHPEVTRLVREVQAEGKPVGAICISPATIAAIFRGAAVRPSLTIGNDEGTAAKLVAMGCEHTERTVRDVTVDRVNRIVSTPAYMLASRISEAHDGIDKLVREVLALVPSEARTGH